MLVDGEPAGGIYLSAIVTVPNGDTINYKTQTREDGSYRIPWLPAATFEFGPEYVINPDQSYLWLEQDTLTTQPGQTLQHDIHIETQ